MHCIPPPPPIVLNYVLYYRAALHSDSQLSEEQEQLHRDELSKLEARIMELEATVKKNDDDPLVSNLL